MVVHIRLTFTMNFFLTVKILQKKSVDVTNHLKIGLVFEFTPVVFKLMSV